MATETNAIQPAETSADTTYTTHQLMKLAELMEQKGITLKRFERIYTSGLLADIFEPEADLDNRNGVRAALKLGALAPRGDQNIATAAGSAIVVDYSMTLEQLIAAGKFDWLNNDINSDQFPVKGEGKAEYETKLFQFDGNISSENAVIKIKEFDPANPWEPAKIEHLLAFGSKYPDEQRKHPILALGSVGNPTFFGKRNVPYLYRRVTGRSLHLDWWSNEWHPFYQFLAIRKKSS